MLTNEKFAQAAEIAKTNDNPAAVIIEYITMPKELRDEVAQEAFRRLEASGLTLADYVDKNRERLREFAQRRTMSLTVLVAFLLDIFEQQAAEEAPQPEP